MHKVGVTNAETCEDNLLTNALRGEEYSSKQNFFP